MNRVKQLREARGWRREDLATHSGLSISTIGNTERCRRKPSRITTRKAIATALGVDESEIWD